jgi:hypothetical protein
VSKGNVRRDGMEIKEGPQLIINMSFKIDVGGKV